MHQPNLDDTFPWLFSLSLKVWMNSASQFSHKVKNLHVTFLGQSVYYKGNESSNYIGNWILKTIIVSWIKYKFSLICDCISLYWRNFGLGTFKMEFIQFCVQNCLFFLRKWNKSLRIRPTDAVLP
jgi:hypothetical protein